METSRWVDDPIVGCYSSGIGSNMVPQIHGYVGKMLLVSMARETTRLTPLRSRRGSTPPLPDVYVSHVHAMYN